MHKIGIGAIFVTLTNFEISSGPSVKMCLESLICWELSINAVDEESGILLRIVVSRKGHFFKTMVGKLVSILLKIWGSGGFVARWCL